MISIITYGRNDNYSYNLVKRTALAFNCLAEVLTEDDEILFTDYNTPDHLPTLPEAIWDTLTDKALSLVKVIRIPARLHQLIKKDSPLPILENVSRNAGIVRSNPKNHWMLSTNPDVLLVLSSKWRNLAELLSTVKNGFYEMPRMDIPESVWSSLNRTDPKTNIRILRDWLICHGAAIAETSPDWQFQKYILFDAPGDFQLAPRDYFFRLRGFDEAMNKYFHSDSNLAKRMWLLNGGRTDHVLGELWVLHQDHYLSGEWAKTVTGIVHNDLSVHVRDENKVEANAKNWGLQDVELSFFSLSEKIRRERVSVADLSSSINGNLPMSQEVNWSIESFYRLCHYQPEVLTLYLRETLRVVPPDSQLIYVGANDATFERVQQMWKDISPSGSAVRTLSIGASEETVSADVVLVDAYYHRSEYVQRRVQLVSEQMQRRLTTGKIKEEKVQEEMGTFANNIDYEAWKRTLFPLWDSLLPQVELRPGALVIVLGCNMYGGLDLKLQDLLSRRGLNSPRSKDLGTHSSEHIRTRTKMKGRSLRKVFATMLGLFHRNGAAERIQGATLPYHAFSSENRASGSLKLMPLYIHHRLMVLRAD